MEQTNWRLTFRQFKINVNGMALVCANAPPVIADNKPLLIAGGYKLAERLPAKCNAVGVRLFQKNVNLRPPSIVQ